jgi:tetratricopeptide (TPR) repeat protein
VVQRGICHQALGRHALAAGDFGVCIGLWPEFAWGYFLRAYSLEWADHRVEAVADYTRALKRDPQFLEAHVNRGLVQLELKEYGAALADLDEALRLGGDDAPLQAGRGMALEGLGRHRNAHRAFARVFVRARSAPDEVRLRLRWVYGFAVSRRRPDRAGEAFAEVLRRHPDHPQALYGRGMMLAVGRRTHEAIAFFTKAIESDPNFSEPRRYRAVLRARVRAFEGASVDVNWCLAREPEAGPALYAAACMAALAAEKSANPAAARQMADQALTFLQKALACGYGKAQAPTDPDLAGVRNRPEFRRRVAAQGPAGKPDRR